jgi:hypothetical protein
MGVNRGRKTSAVQNMPNSRRSVVRTIIRENPLFWDIHLLYFSILRYPGNQNRFASSLQRAKSLHDLQKHNAIYRRIMRSLGGHDVGITSIMPAKAKLTVGNADVAPKQIHRLQMESAFFISQIACNRSQKITTCWPGNKGTRLIVLI